MNRINVQETLEDPIEQQDKPKVTIKSMALSEGNTFGEQILEYQKLEITESEEKKSSSSSERPLWKTGLSSDEITRINREITRQIPPETKIELLREHDFLVRNKFKEGISKADERRLSYVRWQLDNIEDAEIGENLDRLEQFTGRMETFADQIDKLLNKFDPSTRKRRQFKK